MSLFFRKEIKVGEDGFNPSPNFSTKFSLQKIGFPVYDGDGEVVDGPFNIDPGSIGEIVLKVDFQFENYLTTFQPKTISNSFDLKEAIYPTPCLLDFDGDGIVSRGDIQKTYSEYLGMSTSEVNDELGFEINNPIDQLFALTLDVNSNGLIDEEDYLASLEFEGIPGCGTAPVLEYPKYLDEYPDDLAFAYSLRKLRDDYEGPCMTVFLDVDKRKLAPRSANIRFWKEKDAMLGMVGEAVSDASYIGSEFDMYQSWLNFVSEYPWLEDPIDIPFGPDGYVDYSIIVDMMVDPPKAWGRYNPALGNVGGTYMTQEEYNSFMEEWNAPGSGIENDRLSWRLASAVLVDRWYDQRADEQRDFIPVTTLNEIQNEAGGRKHPFTKPTLMVGCTAIDKSTKQVVNHNGVFCLGSALTYGIGQAPWTDSQSNFQVPEYNGLYSSSNDGILCPSAAVLFNHLGIDYDYSSLTSDDLQPGWADYWIYPEDDESTPSENKRFIGRSYMSQDQTNAEFANPWWSSDSLYTNPSEDESNSNGMRTVCGVKQGCDFGGESIFSGFQSFLGSTLGLRPGNSDRRNYNGQPLPPNLQVGNSAPSLPNKSSSGQHTDNVTCQGYTSKYGEGTTTFSYHRDEYKESEVTWPLLQSTANNPYPGEGVSNTFTMFSAGTERYFLGVDKVGDNSKAPSILGNMIEFIGWKDRKSDDFMRDYLSESKRYFTNKKIQQ